MQTGRVRWREGEREHWKENKRERKGRRRRYQTETTIKANFFFPNLGFVFSSMDCSSREAQGPGVNIKPSRKSNEEQVCLNMEKKKGW